MDIFMKNKQGLELINSPFSGCQIWSEDFFLLWSITWLILMFSCKEVYELVKKVTVDSLRKLFHDVSYSIFNFRLKSHTGEQE